MALFKKEPKPKKVKKEKPPKVPKVKRPHKRVSVLEIASLISLFAIVGTVGYLVYKNHIKKTVPETDKELVNQLNASFEKHHKAGKKVDLTEVIDGIESDGIIFSRLTLSDPDSELIFDANANSFGVFENGKGVTYPKEIVRSASKIDTSLWKFAKKNPGDKENPFSYYLLDGCSGKVTVVGGCDVGKNQDIERVAYINVIEKKQEVTIRTNSYETELMVTEDVGDTISHYGRLGKLTVNRLHTDSYHEYGDCKYAYVTSGRVVAEKDGNIDVAYVVSQVAFLQEKDSGTIGKAYASTYRVRNNSEKADEKYGAKKPLEYDDNESQEDNEKIALATGEAAQYTAVVEERIERGLENHPNAIGYAREDSVITIFDSYKEAVEHFSNKTIDNPGVVIITGNGSFSDVLNISDTSITFRGNENVMPQVIGNIEISHTSGNHQIIFENIRFSNNYSSRNNILDYSVKGSSSKQNSLVFKNCEFSYNSAKSSKATIALAATNGIISTQLSVTGSKFNYGQNSQVAISTHALTNEESVINRGTKILSEQIHVIKGNEFKCTDTSKNPAIVTNYAEIKENKFEGFDTVLNLIPTLVGSSDCQFNVTASGNTFIKARYLFSLVDADPCMDSPNFVFNFDGSNSYSKVTHVANFEVATTNRYVEKTVNSWKSRSWYGVSDPSIGVTLDSIVMDLQVEPYFDYFTLSNGDRITSYTQVESDGIEPRTGYTIKALDESDVESTYYLYATFNKEVNVFFKEGTNDAYVTLLSSGDVESLKVKEIPTNIDWLDKDLLNDEETYNELKYYDYESGDKVGALYKIDEQFSTLDGNTFVNCELIQNEKFLRVNHLPEPTPEESEIPEEPESLKVSKLPDDPEQSETPEDPVDPETPEIPVDPETPEDPETPDEPEEVVVKKGLEVYISDIGEKQKLVLTNEENPFISDSDALTQFVVSVPNDAKVVLSGRYDVELQGTVENLVLRDRLNVKFASGSSVSKLCEISGENAENLKLENNGAIEKLVINSKANITNNSLIKNLVTGEVGSKHIEETLQETSGAFIYNKGNILHFVTYAKTEVLNNINGYIDELKVTFVEGYRDLSVGSYITNNGTMCTGEGNIYFYTECKLFNYGVIGLEGRSTVGGLIIIGDHGESDSHDGVVINNVTGIIWAGKNQEDESLVTRTLIIYGVTEGKGEIHPEVSITSDGVIAGTSTDEEKVLIVELDISPNVILEIKI